MNLFGELNDRYSPLVVAALTRRCPICKSEPGAYCNNMPINYNRLEGRIVHYARTVD